MPVPIRPRQVIEESNSYVDYSFLTRRLPEVKKQVTASNKDADILMKIWTEARKEDGSFDINKDLNLSQREITRLKTYGLVAGSNDNLSITERGKKVITVMALGEGNKFEKGRVDKSYMEIMASMDLKGKSGYRIPKFSASSSNNIIL